MQTIIVAAWMLVGAGIALTMVRRGHSPLLWWVLIPCGPLLALIALNAKDEETAFTPVVVRDGSTGPGSLHILVGVDGKDAAIAACREVIDEFGTTIGRVTLATVLDYDIGQVHEAEVSVHEAERWLEEAARALVDEGGPEPEAVVLTGPATRQLVTWAREHDVDLIVVASQSHTSVKHLVVGSIAKGVVADASCPVLVVPPPHPVDDPSADDEHLG